MAFPADAGQLRPHQSLWVMLGKRLAQVALHYGANDIDGTITEGGELSESYH